MILYQSNTKYPIRLLSISKPPPLHYIGDIGIISRNRSIAVVGSRRLSVKGRDFAYSIGYALGKMNINVVNGLAIGCDEYALEGALAAGGKCAAVMPCGLDTIVPRSNAGLADRILAAGGCLISQYPEKTPVQKYQYVERDRLQSGISDGVIVIEAECSSGTMHTVKAAIKQGRKLACIDSRLVEYSSGNSWLEGHGGVCVIKSTADLDKFISMISDNVIFKQMTF